MLVKKTISILLCVCLTACCLPLASVSVFAEDGEGIFTSQDGLWKYRLLEDNTAELYGGYETLAYCGDATTVDIPVYVDGIPVTQIGDFAFSDTQVINIGSNIRLVSVLSFAMCSELISINVSADNSSYCSVDGVLFDKEMTTLVRYPSGSTSDTYTVPDGVEIIGPYSFFSSIYLTDITLSDTVEEIGMMSFGACASLSDIKLFEGLSAIVGYAFYGCENLNEITIPASVTEIDDEVFADSALTTVKGYYDSEAESFAENHGLTFVSVDVITPGDLNDDENVTLADYSVLCQYISGETEITGTAMRLCADVDGDTAIDAFDLFLVDKIINSN